ncbi:hypothetical protein [Streptomyces sp. NPDC088183]|uniref:hypothetical protein n=1 Tax=Streptomyces sp. NPDC088183 TaxID=3160992 RepID=UPI00341A925E
MANVPKDITDTIREMQKEIRALSAAVSRAPAQREIASGDVVVTGEGSITVKDSSGNVRLQMAVFPDAKSLKIWDTAGTLVFAM